MGILNILGSLVNIIRECFRVLPFIFINMETKIKLYPTDYWKYETRAYLNAYFHIQDKEEGKTFEGWAEIRIYPIIRNKIVILMRTVDVQYNRQILKVNPDKPWKSFYLVKYEVQKNKFGIESIEYRQGEGFFAIGKNINLLASTTPW